MRRTAALREHLTPAAAAAVAPATTPPPKGKRAIVRAFAKVPPPEGLAAIEVEEYEPKAAAELGPSEVLIEVRAASCNFPDLLHPSNQHNIKPKLPS